MKTIMKFLRFNAFACRKYLSNSGFNEEQANTLARLFGKTVDEFNELLLDNVATKHDLKIQEKEFEIKLIDYEIKLLQLETRMMKRQTDDILWFYKLFLIIVLVVEVIVIFPIH